MSDRPSGRWSFRVVRGRDSDPDDAEDTPIDGLVADYLATLRSRGARPETLRHAESALVRLVGGMGLRYVQDVSKARIKAWREGRISSGSSNRTANHEVSILSAALNNAVKYGRIEVNPLAGLEALPLTKRHRRRQARALSDDEISRLLVAARKLDQRTTRGGFPREPTLRALLATGARWGELIHTTWADLDMDRRTLTLRGEHTKSGKTRTIPLAPSDFASILSLRDAHVRVLGDLPTAASRVFLGAKGEPWSEQTGNFLNRYLHPAMQIAGIPRKDGSGHVLHVHALRHTAATRWARQGMPLLELQRILGHSDPKLTAEVYVDARVEIARQWILPLPAGEDDGRVPPSKRDRT